MATFFYLVECPKHEECQRSKAKKNIWGWTLEQCQQEIKHHLMASSHHYCPEDEADVLTSCAAIQEATMSEAEHPPNRPKSPPTKRPCQA